MSSIALHFVLLSLVISVCSSAERANINDAVESEMIVYAMSPYKETQQQCRTPSAPTHRFESVLESKGKTICQIWDERAMHGRIIVAFRGSHNFCNWANNAQCGTVQHRFMDGDATQVHKGFVTEYRSVATALMCTLQSMSIGFTDSVRIIFTGHSLGGAIARIAARDYSKLSTQISVVAFGAPRVGHYEFATQLEQRTALNLAIIIAGDPVPHLPHSVGTCERDQFVHYGTVIEHAWDEQRHEWTTRRYKHEFKPEPIETALFKLLPRAIMKQNPHISDVASTLVASAAKAIVYGGKWDCSKHCQYEHFYLGSHDGNIGRIVTLV